MKVCIETDQNGGFSVYAESEQPGETSETIPSETPQQEAGEMQDKQSAPDLKSALMLAGRMLSQAPKSSEPSPFDQGMASALPRPMGA